MKGKIALIPIAAIILILTFAPLVKAYPSLNIFGYTDRPQYKVGDSGSVKFWVVNTSADPATLKNITIFYPWYIPGTRLGGNDTIVISSVVTLNLNQNYSYTHQFTVPNDGRALSTGSVNIKAYFEYYDTSTPPQKHSSYASGTVSMNIAAAPFFMSVAELGMLQNLLLFNIIAVLLAAIIIAAALFMTKRTPPGPPQ